MSEFPKQIGLFIPCYNEEKRINIDAIQSFMTRNNEIVDFYFIDDGSTDATSEVISQHLVDNRSSFLIRLDRNYGKGNALREGILRTMGREYSFYGFVDADLDIPLQQVLELHSRITGTDYLMAISSRNLYSGFSISRPRSISSILMVNIANKLIQLSPRFQDTQCGCKLLKKEVLEICFNNEFISEWLFDIELFLRMKKVIPNSRKRIVEVPLSEMGKSGKSNFRFRQNLKIFRQLYLINSHYR